MPTLRKESYMQTKQMYLCLANDEKSDLEVVNSIRNRTYVKKKISTELNTDPGEGITQKFEFTAKQLNGNIQFPNSGA